MSSSKRKHKVSTQEGETFAKIFLLITGSLVSLIIALALYYQWWWVFSILAFPAGVIWMLEWGSQKKAESEYPDMEPGDAVGIMMLVFMIFIICCIAFAITLDLPRPGWGFLGDLVR